MEFRYGVWTGISGLMGEDGRQLGEANTKPTIFNRGIPAEVHACKYKGSRFDQLINVSALRVAMRHFYEASAITVAVRDYHMAQTNRPASAVPGGWDLYVISRAAVALICHHYRYGDADLNEKIPNDISSLYKLVTGIFVICREMMKVAHPAAERNEPISSEDLYQFADDNHIFRSDNQMVCAGSTSKIIEFLDFANLGRAHPQGEKLQLDRGDDHLSLLGSFVEDLESWYHYSLLTVEFDHYIELETLRRKIEDHPELEAETQPVLDICTAQHKYWIELLGDREDFASTSFDQGVLERQNAVLATLKRAPVKAIPKKMINSRLYQ